MWFKFDKDYNWRVPGKRAFRQFKEGQTVNVTTQCAADAKAAGVGKLTKGEAKTADLPAPTPEAETVFLTDEPKADTDNAG